MPLCEGCGGNYDDKFKFCPHCGRARPDPITININVTSDDVWETCEIYIVSEKKSVFKTDWFFEATAIGIKGRYSAGWSEPLKRDLPLQPGDYYWNISNGADEMVLIPKKCQPKLDALIRRLVSDGWQSVGRGQHWYSERFRRKVAK